MIRKRMKSKKDKGIPLFLSIILVFGILGGFVFAMSRKLSAEMSASAIQNLSESLDLMKGTIEAILLKEAEFQQMIAKEIVMVEEPEQLIRSYNKNQTMVKIALVWSGEEQGISNLEDVFEPKELDFSAGNRVNGLAISESYVNYMGAWAYTMKCPVVQDGEEIAQLYVEYIYDAIGESLPRGFYDGKAMLYIMDAENERLVLNPRGIGERDAGHLNLEDFYRANRIVEEKIRDEVARCVAHGDHVLFYHNIRNKNSLNYMWAVNGGSHYLIGYVPIEAIQREGRAVNQNIFIVVAVMLAAFFICCVLYYFTQRQQNKVRKEREAEREIHNQRLAEALQAAQVASNSKTTFLSNMSHDIRTPMNAVLGFTSLLALDAENPVKVREYTKKIKASGHHLLNLINDVLDVSKIESGKVVLNIEEFTIKDLVASVDAIIRPMAKEKKQAFHVEITNIGHEYLMGDEMRMNQIFINLLSNAVKYTQQGGNIWLRIIGLKQRSPQYEHIRIEVEDDGYGMTPEYVKVIFEPFTRAENSTTNKVQGTGLGMAIAKNVVELMGGTIEVSSEVGKGTRFRVEIEFRIPEGQADLQFWEKSGIHRILAVDRDQQVCGSIQSLMKETGVLVDTSLTMEEALETIRIHPTPEKPYYDIVLLDWELTGRNGAQAVQKLRETGLTAVPVLFLTAYDAEGTQEAFSVEETGILAKPFFVSSFKEKLLEMAAEHGKQTKEETAAENLTGLHFLAAEDNEINSEILKEILSIEGASCEIVENGQLAFERFRDAPEGKFDAILMDVQMPVMNGYDATKAIRALARKDAGEILIIAMTANAFAEDEKEALEAGMDVHLSKPVEIDLLKKVIRQCLREKGAGNEKE